MLKIMHLQKQKTNCIWRIRCIKEGSMQRIRITVYSNITYVVFLMTLSFNELCKNVDSVH